MDHRMEVFRQAIFDIEDRITNSPSGKERELLTKQTNLFIGSTVVPTTDRADRCGLGRRNDLIERAIPTA
jgi:hypothetical protein